MNNKKVIYLELLYRHFYFIALTISAVALLVAYTIEFFGGMMPCNLCIYQRIPYYLLMFLTLFAMLMHSRWHFLYSWYVVICTVVIFSGFSISIFHFCVESGLISYKSKCISDFSDARSLLDIKNIIENVGIVTCDAKQGVFLGISMVVWHIIYSAVSLAICLLALSYRFCSLTHSSKYGRQDAVKL
ncbi:disulfide bond formation protein B [Candidatus Lariskella endosymbiont of Hedychridium roseum]|uniref:disulfide bond formation protein B n=1 Tax=Candidatus Lariskella endosymbiont of Hedychridium roseum TaxID=3077949 RepID=UPI003977DAEC